ncbi:hypothetical protein MMC28_002874 [Mycoblastus sanguinarius]|nr:hypothetical protein [Mycoblastus sanguinarius]
MRPANTTQSCADVSNRSTRLLTISAIIPNILTRSYARRAAPTLRQLAIAYIAVNEGLAASAVSTVDFIFDYLGFADCEVPLQITDPLGALRKLVVVWDAVEEFTLGFVDSSLKFIAEAKANGAEDDVTSEWDEDWEPRPWTLPLRNSEIHRVKRALWRIELFSALFHEPYTFGVDYVRQSSGNININAPWPSHPLVTAPTPNDAREVFVARLQKFEVEEMMTVFEYLSRETIERVYQHHIDEWMEDYHEAVRQKRSLIEEWMDDLDFRSWEEEQVVFAPIGRRVELQRAWSESQCWLAYQMSLGLPFLNQARRQILVDGNNIYPENYPLQRYRCYTGFSDKANIHRLLNGIAIVNGDRFEAFERSWADSPGVHLPSVGWSYLRVQPGLRFHNGIEELRRAGCYLWDR